MEDTASEADLAVWRIQLQKQISRCGGYSFRSRSRDVEDTASEADLVMWRIQSQVWRQVLSQRSSRNGEDTVLEVDFASAALAVCRIQFENHDTASSVQDTSSAGCKVLASTISSLGGLEAA